MVRITSEQDAVRFREFCSAVHYGEAELVKTFGTNIPPAPHHEDHASLVALARQASAFHCVATLLFLGQPIETAVAQSLCPEGMVSLAIKLGLLSDIDGVLQPNALIVPVGKTLLASDTYDAVSRDDGNYVPTLNQPAIHLAAYAINRPLNRALDLCGGFALHAAIVSPNSQTVVTTDLNPRAKEFAEFNAQLNVLDNLDARTGNLFSAVEGESFDLILCNPPFVISPSATASFRENPLEMDGFVQEMIRQVPGHLEDGGFFQTICEWAEFEDETAEDRIRSWTSESGCDVWVLLANRQLPSTYARARIREMTDDDELQQDALGQWEDYFTQRNVQAIRGGLIFMRRRDGENWFDTTQINQAVTQPVGRAVLAGFGCRDLLFRSDSSAVLLKTRLQLAEGLQREQHSRWTNASWQTDSITLSVSAGVPVSVGIDSSISAMMDEFDGQQTVSKALDGFAKKMNLPIETTLQQAIPMIRQLMSSGILVVS